MASCFLLSLDFLARVTILRDCSQSSKTSPTGSVLGISHPLRNAYSGRYISVLGWKRTSAVSLDVLYRGRAHTTCRCWRVLPERKRDCNFDISNASFLSEQIEVLLSGLYIEWWTRSNPVGDGMKT